MHAERVTYFDFFKPGNRQRLLILVSVAIGSNWVGNGVISYYLPDVLKSVGITSTLQQAYYNFGLQIWNC